MAKAPPSAKRDRIRPLVPALVDYTHNVIYGDLWERPGLSKRDRSLDHGGGPDRHLSPRAAGDRT